MFRQVLRSESSDDEATSSSEDENSDVTMEDDLQEEGGGNTDTKGKGKQKADVPKGKGKQKAEDSHFDTGFFDEDLAAGVEYDSDSGPHFERRAPGPPYFSIDFILPVLAKAQECIGIRQRYRARGTKNKMRGAQQILLTVQPPSQPVNFARCSGYTTRMLQLGIAARFGGAAQLR
ncbi:hypothetical protein R3P38DRAFT_2787405 [Favolaschia claudopus]|uniref:Uncharacterized protein n=1 Tax=Favolaschia claudopus TaxID=2862362 RepID=A0AAW0ANF2_9AGAR